MRGLALVLLLGTVADAQSDVLARLRGGELEAAVAALEADAPLPGPERLECAQRLHDLAPAAGAIASSGLRVKALTQALRLLRADGAEAERERRWSLLASTGEALAQALAATELRPRSAAFDTRVQALQSCREALRLLGRATDPRHVAAGVALVPLLLARESFGEVQALCRETLTAELSPADRQAVRAALGWALLRHKKGKEAVEYLPDWLARAPRDPAWVLPVARLLPSACAEHTLVFVGPVLARDPSQTQRAAWRECLDLFYRALDPKNAAEPGVRAFLDSHTIRKPLPQVWEGASWRDGYRVWRPDFTEPGKVYQGAHALTARLPASAGWRVLPQPPAELLRWQDAPLCMQRGGGSGAVLVVYWFGPDQHYWYGHTPVKAGVTSKTVRGFQRGGIADLVAEVAYGIEADRLGKGLRQAQPLPFAPGVKGTTIRKQWRVGKELYDETWASVGQVTVEVLLRIREDELELLEPEVRWLYANVGVE